MRAIKDALEWIAAVGLLIVAAPCMAIAAAAVLLEDGGPVFFVQDRVGRGRRQFPLFKFRSMRVNELAVSELGQVDSTHTLVTSVGRWLRRLKIDELPQLLNVVRGEMGLIGPRPTVEEQVRDYTPFQMRRLEVKPGLTGWVQVSGGTKLTWPERIIMDVWYIDHWSPWIDLKIVVKTIYVVLRGEELDRRALDLALLHASALEARTGGGPLHGRHTGAEVPPEAAR